MIPEQSVASIQDLQGRYTPVRGQEITDPSLGFAMIQLHTRSPGLARAFRTSFETHLHPEGRLMSYRHPDPDIILDLPNAAIGFTGFLAGETNIRAVYMIPDGAPPGTRAWVGLFSPMGWLNTIQHAERRVQIQERTASLRRHWWGRLLDDLSWKLVQRNIWRQGGYQTVDLPAAKIPKDKPPAIFESGPDAANYTIRFDIKERDIAVRGESKVSLLGEEETILPIGQKLELEFKQLLASGATNP